MDVKLKIQVLLHIFVYHLFQKMRQIQDKHVLTNAVSIL